MSLLFLASAAARAVVLDVSLQRICPAQILEAVWTSLGGALQMYSGYVFSEAGVVELLVTYALSVSPLTGTAVPRVPWA